MSYTFPTAANSDLMIISPYSIKTNFPELEIICGSEEDGTINYSNGLTIEYRGYGIWIVTEINGIYLPQRRDYKTERLKISTLKVLLEEF